MNLEIQTIIKSSVFEINNFVEEIDTQILDKLISSNLLNTVSWNAGAIHFDNEKHQLQLIKKLIKNDKLKVSYKRPKYGLGRVYPNKSLSLCSLRREIRHTLAFDKYVDLDIVNCHPEILNQLCINNNIKTKYLNEYVFNRVKILKETQDAYNITRDEAKKLFISLMYYGRFENSIKTNKEQTDFIYNFVNELKIISEIFIKANPDITKIIKSLQKKNLKGSVMSIILQEKERLILESIYIHLVDKKIINNNDCVLCFDGIMIKKDKYDEKILKELESVISNELKFKLQITKKEFDNHYLKELESVSILVDKNSFEYQQEQFELNHCKIINKSVYIKQTDDDNIFFSKKMLNDAYEHLTCTIKDKENELFIKHWTVGNQSIRRYDNFDIYPNPAECPKEIYNLWMPFEAEKIEDYTPNQEALDTILNHIKILCNNEQEVADYFIKWIGQMIQYPAIKTICPTMISNEGAGKGTLNKLIQKMLGNKKCMETTNPSRDVWGQFNSCMISSFFVNLNELSKKDTIEAEGKIKALITDGNIFVNPKGVNQFEIKSYHRFFITTNKLEPISTSNTDRRNLIIRSSDELCQKTKKNVEYFRQLYKYLDDDNVIATCYNYFKNIPDLDKFNDIPIPKTEYQENLKQLELTPPEQFLKHLAINETQKKVELGSNDIFKKFTDYCINNNIDYQTTPLKLSVRIASLNIKGITKKKTRTCNLSVLDITEINKHFGISNNEFIDEDDEPEPEPIINISSMSNLDIDFNEY